MKKLISIFLCVFTLFLLTGCSSKVIDTPYNDYNNNYTSNDVDENGDPIYSNTDKYSEETTSSETQLTSENLLKVHFIDCGNADSIFIELPDKKTMLIDAGNNPDGEDIVTYITTLGYSQIDYIVGTHPHEDHIGGMDDVINKFSIGIIYMPYIPDKYVPSTKTYEEVLTAIQSKGLSITSPQKGQIIDQGDFFSVEFLNSTSTVESDDMNAYSLVIMLTYNNHKFIFTADAGEEIEKEILNDYTADQLKCTVLKVGHHGSSYSSCEEWISTLSPTYAYIPCGEGNQYGHPHHETINRLERYKITYYEAMEDGTVVMTSDGFTLEIETKMTGDVPLGDSEWDSSMIKK